MQLYAFDRDKKLIFARDALKQMDYFCLECEGPLRRRGGLHRKDHFYHLDAMRECRQNGKTLEHLNVQLFFLNELPLGECVLEKRFPEINRIADVVWEEKKLIFEIQCSPISSKEVDERNQDYQKVGYEVVWILHDKRFNQKKLSGAEHFLYEIPHYFTNMTEDGKGDIYDQFSLIDKGFRIGRLKPLPIDVKQPKRMTHHTQGIRLRHVLSRLQKSPLYFSCDLVDRCTHQDNVEDSYVEEAEQFEQILLVNKSKTVFQTIVAKFFQFVIRPYQLVLQFFLERACR